MPQRITPQVITLATKDIQGADSWIKVQRSNKMASRRIELQAEMAEKGVTFDARGRADGGEFSADELSRIGLRRVAETLIAWNWVDGDGNDLPQPDHDDPEKTIDLMIEVLTEAEIEALATVIANFLTNPGEAKGSRHSSRR